MTENISIVLQLLTLLGIVFAIYKYFRDPDEKSKEEIALIKQAQDLRDKLCAQRHSAIDDNIVLIKENHLRHIEADISELKIGQARILAILEERSSLKKN